MSDANHSGPGADPEAGPFDAHHIQTLFTHQLADQVEAMAHRLRHSDLSGVMEQTGDFARRNPLLFFGGAAALGFAATRLMGGRGPDRSQPEEGDGHRTVLAELNKGARHG